MNCTICGRPRWEGADEAAEGLCWAGGRLGGFVDCRGIGYEREKVRAEMAEAEVARLRGIKPELPPRPPDGTGLPRYGLRWNGPTEPLAVPMPDGYWTPWHIAEAEVARLKADFTDMRTVQLATIANYNGLRATTEVLLAELASLRAVIAGREGS